MDERLSELKELFEQIKQRPILDYVADEKKEVDAMKELFKKVFGGEKTYYKNSKKNKKRKKKRK